MFNVVSQEIYASLSTGRLGIGMAQWGTSQTLNRLNLVQLQLLWVMFGEKRVRG